MRLGKNKVDLPKLYIFPAFTELFEELIGLHGSELKPSGWLGVVLRSRRWLLLSVGVHPATGGGNQPSGSCCCSRFPVHAAGGKRDPLLSAQTDTAGTDTSGRHLSLGFRCDNCAGDAPQRNLRLGCTETAAAAAQCPSSSARSLPR